MAKNRAPKTVEFNMPLKSPKGGGRMPVYSRVGHYEPIPKGNRQATPAKTTREVTEVPKPKPLEIEGPKPRKGIGAPRTRKGIGAPRVRTPIGAPPVRTQVGAPPVRRAITGPAPRALPAPANTGTVTSPLSSSQQGTTKPPKKPATTTTKPPKKPAATTTKPTTPKPPTPPPATSGPHSVLGVHSGATPAQLKTAFNKLARQYHPDKNPSPEAANKMKEINAAYAKLTGGN
jgi:hypothetical protein